MGSGINLEFLLEKFSKLIEKYHLVLALQKSKYEAIFDNEHAKITMYTFSREDGMSVGVTNLKDNKVYYLTAIIKKKGIHPPDISEQLKAAGLLNYDDDFKTIVTNVAFMLEQYCDDILNGDFSIMEEG